MAKGDSTRTRNAIDYEKGYAQNNLDNLRVGLTGQNQGFYDNYRNAFNRQWNDYGDIMGQYKNFADTGGYSEEDKSNLRARSVAPIRAAYANASRDVDRNLARQGGFVPGFNAAKAKLARESSYAMSDASTNAEAALAQMINEGKRFGVAGQGQMFGTAPGMTNAFANHLLSSSGQLLGIEGLQGDLARNVMQARIGSAGVPGNFGQAIGNIKDIAEIGKGILGGWM